MSRRGAAVLAAALALAAPGTALAQSAGDDQYRDPFQGQSGQQDPGTNDVGSGGGSNPAGGSQGAPVAPTAPSAAPAQGTDDETITLATLPRTGLSSVIVAALGVLLIGAGVALRRSVPA